MAASKPCPRFQVGDRVKIRYSDWRARVVELRGALGAGGAFIYRVRVPLKPKPKYIELREDQLIAIPTPAKAKPSSDGAALPKATTVALPLFRKGDRVEIRDTNWRGRILDLRLSSAPGRAYIYRVRVPAEPRSIYVELPENYLVGVPSPIKKEPGTSTRRRARDGRKEK